MKKFVIGFSLGLALVCSFAVAGTFLDIIYWGFGGMNRAREWVSPDGRMNQQNLLQESTSIDFWGSPKLPEDNSISEITLHRNTYGLGYDERLNISAMVHADSAAYRFGVERVGTGQFRDMIFCFENVTPGVASCVLKLTKEGAYTSDNGGATWRKL